MVVNVMSDFAQAFDCRGKVFNFGKTVCFTHSELHLFRAAAVAANDQHYIDTQYFE